MAASPDVPAGLRRPTRADPWRTGLPAAAPPRAGRDLGSAIAVGLALGAIILVPLLTVRQSFVGFSRRPRRSRTWELRDALRRGAGIEVPLPVLLVGGQAMIWLSWPFGLRAVALRFAATALGCLVWRMRAGAAHYLRDVLRGALHRRVRPAVLLVRRDADGRADGVGRVLTFMLCGGRLGRRRLRRRRARRQAPDGPDDQPEEVVGGLRRLAGRRDGHRRADRDSLLLDGPGGSACCRCAARVERHPR